MISRIKAIFAEANANLNLQREEEEKKKLGLARGGSAGAIMENGEALYTDCGRKAQARLLGQQSGKSENDRMMFQGGFAVENHIEEYLKTAGIPYAKEVEKLGLIGDVEVSGRADFDILLDGEWVGVEVKSMASPFSTIKQVKNKFPMIKHLVQACTYTLLYERDKWLVAVGNVFNANERGFKVPSSLRWYSISRKGTSFYCTNEAGERVKLPFTIQDIGRYYLLLQKETQNKTLLPRPTELELNVDTYNRCKYCPMEGACNEFEAGQIDFDTWIKKNSQ